METLTTDTATTTKTWGIDPAHSSIRFSVRHMVVSKATGHFNSFSGTAITEGNDFTTAKIHFEAETASIETGNADRNGHLKSDDFFNAEQFPKLTFESTSLTKIDDENYKMVGDLTIRDVTKSVELNVEVGGIVSDPYGFQRAGFHVNGKINRVDFGVKFNGLLEAGGAILAESVNLDCDVEFVTK